MFHHILFNKVSVPKIERNTEELNRPQADFHGSKRRENLGPLSKGLITLNHNLIKF